MPSPRPPKDAVEDFKQAVHAYGPDWGGWIETGLQAAYPVIFADLKERLLSKEALQAGADALSSIVPASAADRNEVRIEIEAAFNQAMEGETSTQGGDASASEGLRRAESKSTRVTGAGAGDAGPGPEASVRCEGAGVLAKNFGIDSPGRPDVVPCPGCPDCKPEGETDHA